MARETLAARLAEWVRRKHWRQIGETEWNEARDAFPQISEETLGKHLESAGVAVAQPWRGVDTSTLDALERSLVDLAEAYVSFPKQARAAVIRAKDKTRFAARNPRVATEKRAMKNEMVEWMLVWLGDPRMFADWARLRKVRLASNPDLPTQP